MELYYWDFCDKNGNRIWKEKFAKWETIYYKEPNTDIIDPTPEMTMNEIMRISDNDIKQILDHYTSGRKLYVEHIDKKWDYVIINGKKLYHYPPNFIVSKNTRIWVSENTPYINVEEHEWPGNVYWFAIAMKKWNKLNWIYCDYDWKIYRWELRIDEFKGIYPKGYKF